MKTILTKIAHMLAFIIGGIAVFAGAQVLLGNHPGIDVYPGTQDQIHAETE